MGYMLGRAAVRFVMLAAGVLAMSGSQLQAGTLQRYQSLVTKAAWYQLCGNKRSLPFDPQFSCCCYTQATGKHCVRHGNNGFMMNCIPICDAARCM